MSYRFAVYAVKKKTPDDGQRSCPKYVEYYSKNKFEKLVHLVGFIIRIYHDARSPERQILPYSRLRSSFQLTELRINYPLFYIKSQKIKPTKYILFRVKP